MLQKFYSLYVPNFYAKIKSNTNGYNVLYNMTNLSTPVKFTFKFIVVFIIGILMGNYVNGFNKKITKAYVQFNNNRFKNFVDKKKVKFKALRSQAWMIKIDTVDNNTAKKNWCELNIWGIFYLPLLLYFSLMIAFKQKKYLAKILSFVGGLLVLFGFLYVLLYYKIVYQFHTIDKTEPDFGGGFYYDFVYRFNHSIIDNANFYLLMALVIWLLILLNNQSFTANFLNTNTAKQKEV